MPSTKKKASALNRQVAGEHYKALAFQPVEYIMANDLGFVEGAVIKYVSRWKNKGGVEDLRKARHFLDIYIEFLESRARASKGWTTIAT